MTPPNYASTCEFMLINERIFYYLKHDDGGDSSDFGQAWDLWLYVPELGTN